MQFTSRRRSTSQEKMESNAPLRPLHPSGCYSADPVCQTTTSPWPEMEGPETASDVPSGENANLKAPVRPVATDSSSRSVARFQSLSVLPVVTPLPASAHRARRPVSRRDWNRRRTRIRIRRPPHSRCGLSRLQDSRQYADNRKSWRAPSRAPVIAESAAPARSPSRVPTFRYPRT